MFRVWGLGYGIYGLGFKVQGLGRVKGVLRPTELPTYVLWVLRKHV